MKQKVLWKISVTTTTEAEESVAELLAKIFALDVSTYTDEDTKISTISVFYPQKPLDRDSVLKSIREGLENIRRFGLNTAPGKVSCIKIRQERWAHSWKRHFKPIEIGKAVLIKPSWNRRKARKGQKTVILNPGLSFGTGQHATTRFCLEQIVVAAGRRRGVSPQSAIVKKSLLDIGTGSGILAITAVKLGYEPVHAFDFDPESVRVARANVRNNRMNQRIRVTRHDLTRIPVRSARKYDVVCANLISTLLIAERERIISRLQPGGVLVLAGILKVEFEKVRTAFLSSGMKLIEAATEKEWRSGAFTFGTIRKFCHLDKNI